ncbi:MAG: lysylphosphatidylglycerol synthase transmembrane domain-containing protein [Candidatus Cloacimonetes bacterium]|nr:flippase-like domain-containing protein [Candidatus Cloacimonadota bacterium]MCB5268873.1 flippase-like domain-containing protein [Candidatus Cloacimonadota bacterium]MCK9334401.1 flippase-like domain-containing protein [Candidatus Cloacimonadota bacterium]MDD2543416.1 lysylphosphatidylglycerol synthase transmembrane domain-containing protein [Candidatus Cloacimonadota bacterium]MDD2682687.1 lysylphosphatidylglycerol synthase transmembrane domain-containing protein [Candidatus Cloacimonadota
MTKRNILILILGSIVGLVLIYFWQAHISWDELYGHFRNLDLKLVSLASVVYLFAYFVRSIRWNLLLSQSIKISIFRSWMYAMAGNLLNYLIPIRAGELVKAWFIKHNHNQPIVQTLPSVFIDKSFDTLAILAVILLIPFLTIQLSLALLVLLALLAMVFVVSIGIILLAAYRKDKAVGILQAFFSWLPGKVRNRINKFVLLFVQGLNVFEHHPLKLLGATGLTLLGIALDGLYFYLLFVAFGISFPFLLALFGYTLINMSYALPQPPAQLGSNEWMMIVIFSMGFGLTKSEASAIMAFAHVLTAILMLVFGSVAFAISGLEVLKMIFKGEQIDAKSA